jgi:hypothetical protein
MRKSFYVSAAAKVFVATAMCAVVGGCSDTTAPLVGQNSVVAHRSASDEIPSTPPPMAVFVIGDAEATDIGTTVNFWGAQWWKNNQMSDVVSHGVASFKGYATTADNVCGGTWQSRPGNSYDPPATLDADIAVIVTSTVIKDGAAIHGDIKRILLVHQDGGYGPNPGHSGNGVVTGVVCDGAGSAT